MNTAAILPYVQAEVRECPQVLADRAIIDAARDFCRESRTAWYRQTDDLLATDVDADTEEVVVTYRPPAGQVIYAPVRILVGGTERTAVRGPVGVSAYSSFLSFVLDGNKATYGGIQAVAQTIDAVWSVMPALSSPTIPDALAEWTEAVAAGAKAKLMVMAQMKWFAPDVATYQRQEFQSGVNRARIAAAKNFSNASLRCTGMTR